MRKLIGLAFAWLLAGSVSVFAQPIGPGPVPDVWQLNGTAVRYINGPAQIPGIDLLGAATGSTTIRPESNASGAWILPSVTDQFVGRATSDTFLNKAFDTSGSGNTFFIAGVAVTGNSGTGSVARTNNPVFVGPTLGAAVATSLNGNAFTAGSYTLAGGAGKTFNFANSLIVAGTDGTTLTFQDSDTYIGRNTVDTVINKVMSGASNTFSNIALSSIASIAANTYLGSVAGGAPQALTINGGASCTSALIYTNGSGFGCSVSAGTGTVTSDTTAAGTGVVVSGTCVVTTTGTCTVAVDKATAANLEAATSNKVLTADVVFTSEVTVTYGATTTFDFSTFINAVVTLTGNITTVTASNMKAGQAGTLTFIQDGTGSRTLPATFNTNFKWAGAVQPVLSTAAGAVDVIFYSCRTTTYCLASLGKAFN